MSIKTDSKAEPDTDGVFRWWWARGRLSQADDLAYSGPFFEKDQARYAAEVELDVGDVFVLVEADKQNCDYNVFSAHRILDDFADENDGLCEDGIDLDPSCEERRELERRLAQTFRSWADENGIRQRFYPFGKTRRVEECVVPLRFTHAAAHFLAGIIDEVSGFFSGLTRWRHKTRGSEYLLLGEAEAQVSRALEHHAKGSAAGRCLQEGDRLVVYMGADGKLWARFPDEFHDGRFEQIQTATKDGDSR